MREQIELGPAPVDEDCAQVGEDGYEERAHKEARAFVTQLWRLLKRDLNVDSASCPESFRIAVKSFAHDFGRYYEAAAVFDDDDEAAVDLAYHLEANLPLIWDEDAKQELGLEA